MRIQHQLSTPAGGCAVQQAEPPQTREVWKREDNLNRRRCAGGLSGQPRSAAPCARISTVAEIEINLRGCSACTAQVQHTTLAHYFQTNPNCYQKALIHQSQSAEQTHSHSTG